MPKIFEISLIVEVIAKSTGSFSHAMELPDSVYSPYRQSSKQISPPTSQRIGAAIISNFNFIGLQTTRKFKHHMKLSANPGEKIVREHPVPLSKINMKAKDDENSFARYLRLLSCPEVLRVCRT